MKYLMRRFLSSDSGATAVEYGLIVLLVAVAIVVGISASGNKINDLFVKTATTAGDKL
jgi:pilus assembly protein Flp/PilA